MLTHNLQPGNSFLHPSCPVFFIAEHLLVGGLPGRVDCGEIRKDQESFGLYDEWCTFLNLSRREVIQQRLRNILKRTLESVLFYGVKRQRNFLSDEQDVQLIHVLKG